MLYVTPRAFTVQKTKFALGTYITILLSGINKKTKKNWQRKASTVIKKNHNNVAGLQLGLFFFFFFFFFQNCNIDKQTTKKLNIICTRDAWNQS